MDMKTRNPAIKNFSLLDAYTQKQKKLDFEKQQFQRTERIKEEMLIEKNKTILMRINCFFRGFFVILSL
jgi:hypothetical protein